MKEELHIVYKIEQNQDQELDAALKACVRKHGWHWCNTSFNYKTGERGLDFDREEPTRIIRDKEKIFKGVVRNE